jgi:hypothetical protein
MRHLSPMRLVVKISPNSEYRHVRNRERLSFHMWRETSSPCSHLCACSARLTPRTTTRQVSGMGMWSSLLSTPYISRPLRILSRCCSRKPLSILLMLCSSRLYIVHVKSTWLHAYLVSRGTHLSRLQAGQEPSLILQVGAYGGRRQRLQLLLLLLLLLF